MALLFALRTSLSIWRGVALGLLSWAAVSAHNLVARQKGRYVDLLRQGRPRHVAVARALDPRRHRDVLALVGAPPGDERRAVVHAGASRPRSSTATSRRDRGRATGTRARSPSIVKAGLLRVGRPKDEVELALQDASAHELAVLERGLPVLATVAMIAPLLGFLGTVTGMINSFEALATVGLNNPAAVATGHLRGAHHDRRRPDDRHPDPDGLQLLRHERERARAQHGIGRERRPRGARRRAVAPDDGDGRRGCRRRPPDGARRSADAPAASASLAPSSRPPAWPTSRSC